MQASSSSSSVAPRQGSPRPTDGSGLRSRRNSWSRSSDALTAGMSGAAVSSPVAEFSVHNYPPPRAQSSWPHPLPESDEFDPRFSQASLDSPVYQRDQDDIHLRSLNVTDPEASPLSPGRRRQGRYSDVYGQEPGSALGRGAMSATLRAVSKSIRRVSQRAINFRTVGLEQQTHHVRLRDDAIDGMPIGEGAASRLATNPFDDPRTVDEPAPPLEPPFEPPLKLRGITLGIFGPTSKIRKFFFNVLVWSWTEPIVLLLIIADAVILSLQARHSLLLPEDGRPARIKGYFKSWEDWAIFGLFILFTVELVARTIVSGFILDPEVPTSRLFAHITNLGDPDGSMKKKKKKQPTDPLPTPSNYGAYPPTQSNLGRSPSTRENAARGPKTDVVSRFYRAMSHASAPFTLSHEDAQQFDSVRRRPAGHTRGMSSVGQNGIRSQPSNININHAKSFSSSSGIATYWTGALPGMASNSDMYAAGLKPAYKSLPFVLSIARQHSLVERGLPYLRHSWNRIDAIAVLSFWAAFVLSTLGYERTDSFHISLFRALSVLRCARLLAVTRGTTTIMHSLKLARPLLANVAYFVMFAMILFSVIGVQSLRGSMRRQCVLVSTTPGVANITLEQACGGHINDTTLQISQYIGLPGGPDDSGAKGFTCPLGQLCVEQENNPHTNIQSFDDIVVSALQLVIIASANTWAPVMYSAIDAEQFIVVAFFLVALVILNFWLINLFVAVITNSFAAIRSQTKKSAFGADTNAGGLLPDVIELMNEQDATKTRQRTQSFIRVAYVKTRYIWIILVLGGIAVQALRRPDITDWEVLFMDRFEMGITFAFAFEIMWRFAGFLPDWRAFYQRNPGNLLDTSLAISTMILQLPVIKHNPVYPWLTILQLVRFYRVILEVPRMRPLLLSVFGNTAGLLNMSIFLLLTNFIAALFAVQIFRGDINDDNPQNFSQLWLSFIAMYQVLSSENWTDVLYITSEAETQFQQTIITALFVVGWFFFANFILVQLFVAVINENFQIAEEIKQGRQFDRFRQKAEPEEARVGWLDRINPYNWFRAAPESVNVSDLGQNALPIRIAVMQAREAAKKNEERARAKPARQGWFSRLLKSLQGIVVGNEYAVDEEIPMRPVMQEMKRDSTVSRVLDDHDQHLEILAAFTTPDPSRELDNMADHMFERRARKADFINAHPSYDRALWILSQTNPLRRLCQRLVMPSRGERIYGKPPNPTLDLLFRLFLFGTVIAGLAVAAASNPNYRRIYFEKHGSHDFAWFNYAEATFGFVLVLEFTVKVIADGFAFTPNGYLLSLWNCMDFLILLASVTNIVDSLSSAGGLSRFTRASKAFRALRLITLVHTLRETFQSLIFVGALRILDAAMLAVLYMIPYAVWGLNIFSGKLFSCNDESAADKAGCVGEYIHTPFDGSNDYGYLVPRVWENPSPSTEYSFDTFQSSFLILFEIVSLEGWVDVMQNAMSITGPDQQPSQNASQLNAIFFLSYILLGALIILTLFVSIIIGNFSARSGMALLTKEQQEWIDLQKLVKRQKPSHRPEGERSGLRRWCYDRAVNKHGFWSRIMTVMFVVHIGWLMSLNYTVTRNGSNIRDVFFLSVSVVYITDIVIRFIGLGWASFKENGWNIFDCIVAGGSLITTVIALGGFRLSTAQQLQKLFLVLIAFKLVQKSNRLNHLFKTAVASLPAIGKLMTLWLCLFLFYGVLYLEVFGLTRWGSSETPNQNYSTLGRALTMLAFMSTGEGWNAYMHDYTVEYPFCTEAGPDQRVSDCGSTLWSYTLFISWNILSMYIFVNMFTGVVVENFSYVFQSSGGTSSLDREEMRAFKKIWQEYADPQTKRLPRPKFPQFFGKLSGVFEVRIYSPEHRIRTILDRAKYTDEEYARNQSLDPNDKYDMVAIDRLKAAVKPIDFSKIKARKAVYSRFFHEAVLIDKKEGLDFTRMLLLLAHHKLINDDRALELKDLLARKAAMSEVMDHVRLDKVRSLLRMIVQRRKFLIYREAKMQQYSPTEAHTADITQGRDWRETPRSTYYIDDVSPPLSPYSRTHSPQASWSRNRASNVSMLSQDARLSRDGSPASRRHTQDPEHNDPAMLTSMTQSGWTTMLDDEDEDR
ncbi:Ion transport protein-domain-containing protein [Auriculariales sp. MPI-PUGE-AT-0066]|nr:Ion transport protein-domain-containing protein [Auriculariales sp. MPI-PUGE-AT-0066]